MLKTRKSKSVEKLSDRQLEREIRTADRVIAGLPDTPADGSEAARLLPVLKGASHARQAAAAELARREHERTQAEQEQRLAPLRHAVERAKRQAGRSVQLRALDEVARFSHRELAGVTLVADKLTTEEGEELLRLAVRRADGEKPLDADQLARYETLVGRAAGDDGLFARRRAELAAEDKLARLRAAERRHPQAESLVAAVMADETLFEGLRHTLRDTEVVDEYGRKVPGAVAAVVYSPENISSLFLVLNLIAANNGEPITVPETGITERDLPAIPRGSLTQLRRNGWLTVTEDGVGLQVGLGDRTRAVAQRWGITL